MARFHNPGNVPERNWFDFLGWRLTRRPVFWPDWIEAEPGPAPPRGVRAGRVRVTFVNHSTVLIQCGALNILTDPIWSERASPVAWTGPRRRRPPGIRFEDLPPIHAVLISHNHYDHLDLPTLERLAREHRPRFVAPLGDAALLVEKGIEPHELGWWQHTTLEGAGVTSVPAQHFSGRGFGDRNRSLWCGYAIEAAEETIYFAGDTGLGPHFDAIRRRFPRIRLAMLPVGAYLPRWFMGPVHLSPGEAVRAYEALGADLGMAIHFGTFPMADDGEGEALEELVDALDKAGVPASRFWLPAFGEGRDIV